MPTMVAGHIKDAVDRAAGRPSAWGKLVDRLGTLEITGKKDPGFSMGEAVGGVIDMFPITPARIKMGVTTGLGLPNPAYYLGIAMGNVFQIYQSMGLYPVVKAIATDPAGATRMALRQGKMTGAIMSRLWKNGAYTPDAPALVTADGRFYTTDMVARLAERYGLKSSFIQAETAQSLARDIKQAMPSAWDKMMDWGAERGVPGAKRGIGKGALRAGRKWQETLIETATAVDNFFRVGIFVNALEAGESAAEAASLARKTVYDYGALTEFEKSKMRNLILFYSFFKKNQELFWDTLLTNPHRILGQLRLLNGMWKINTQDDPEIVVADYLRGRMPVYVKQSVVNTHRTSGYAYILPPLPVMDAVNFPLEIFDMTMYEIPELDSLRNAKAHQERLRASSALLARFAPWYQAPLVAYSGMQPFGGRGIEEYNRIPQFFVELDETVLGGLLTNTYLNKSLKEVRDPASNEGIGDAGIYWHAENGFNWWAYRNLIQIPGFGRSMDGIQMLDRANAGPVEFSVEGARALRRLYKPESWTEPLPRQLAEPRPGMTGREEFLGYLGARPVELPSEPEAFQRRMREQLRLGREEVKKFEPRP